MSELMAIDTIDDVLKMQISNLLIYFTIKSLSPFKFNI